MSTTKIEWADKVWNPVTGCTKVSAGCKNCYAERMAKRLAGRCGYPAENPFAVTLHPDKLDEPLRWRKPQRIFVCSMGDLFHKDVPEHFIDRVLRAIDRAPQHTYLLLSKRPQNFARYLHDALKFRPNIYLGVSVEDQQTASERIPLLLQTPAAKRFVSYEPALSGVDFTPYLHADYSVLGLDGQVTHGHGIETLDWVIMGGESGPGARPMHLDWARSVRDQCKAAGVAFWFKQWGEWGITTPPPPEKQHPNYKGLWVCPDAISRMFNKSCPEAVWMEPLGKARAGCLLDGVEHKEMP